MKKFLYSIKTDLIFSEPVKDHTFVLRATPLVEPGQESLRSSLACQPDCRLAQGSDAYGNTVFQGYIQAPHTSFSFSSTGEVSIDSQRHSKTEPAPYYAKPTELTKLKGTLLEYFEQNRVSGCPDKIADHWLELISKDFRYKKGVTNVATTASEAWALEEGVCQDYSQILLALLRGDGILCRYVAGLLTGEGATHSWVEFYNGNSWVGIDPTHHRHCNEEYMKISQGLDFSECALERGVFRGNATQTMYTKANLIEI